MAMTSAYPMVVQRVATMVRSSVQEMAYYSDEMMAVMRGMTTASLMAEPMAVTMALQRAHEMAAMTAAPMVWLTVTTGAVSTAANWAVSSDAS